MTWFNRGNVSRVTEFEIPATGSAEVHVLHDGYVGLDGDDERVSGTVTLIIDGDAVIVVDPGMVAARERAARRPRRARARARGRDRRGLQPPPPGSHRERGPVPRNARIHDHWAVYEGDRWIDQDARRGAARPVGAAAAYAGHTGEDISTVASTAGRRLRVHPRLVVSAAGPEDDPLGTDAAALKASRELLLSFATVIIPGHGAPFRPGARG